MTFPKYFVFFKPDGTPQQDMTVCVEPGASPPSMPGTVCMEVDSDSGVSLQNMRLIDGEVVEVFPDEVGTDLLEDARFIARRRVQKDYSEAVAAGFTWNGKMLQANPQSRAALQLYVATSAAAKANKLPFPTIAFTCSDNSVIDVLPSEWPAIGALLATHLNTTHAKYQTLKESVAKATSVENLDYIKW